MSETRRIWVVSATAGMLWLAVVALSALVSFTPLSRISHVALPAGVTPFIWGWATPWQFILPIAGALAVSAVLAAILHTVPSRAFATTWLAAVASGAIVGITLDAVDAASDLLSIGWTIWAIDIGSRAAIGAYWGLLYGWIPALVAVHGRDEVVEAPSTTRRHALPAIAAAFVALMLLGGAAVIGSDVTQAQVRVEAEATDPGPADGSLRPDPQASGEAVPERADGPGVTGDDTCTPDRAMILLGSSDAATGHRVQSVRLMNFSDAPCVITGYPDIAFGDQNGHHLDVTVEHGPSFMAQDPGAVPIEIPAGGEAVAFIGWDANSTHGTLVARTMWGAIVAGEERGSWPIENDVVAGSTVSITAWMLPDAASAD